MNPLSVRGKLVDILNQQIYPAEIFISAGKINSIKRLNDHEVPDQFILPGFIDSHVHIESSMLVPAEFARLAVVHGTVGTVSDPHEIANVCGMNGVEYMIENGGTVPFKFNFGAPSCVPATVFETAGDKLDPADVRSLLERDDIKYLSEMMNFPGVLQKDEEVMKKIAAARGLGKPVDGHAPGLMGDAARDYILAGISTDHECFTAAEALDKLGYGMKIIIREGSAAKNFEALADLLHEHSSNMMFCSDDKHPDSLVEGHINKLCSRAIAKGVDLFKILNAACVNPVIHYKLDVGLLRENDHADLIIVKDCRDFEVIQTYISGKLVAENGNSLIQTTKPGIINNFHCSPVIPGDFRVEKKNANFIPVIEALDGQLITNQLSVNPVELTDKNDTGHLASNVQIDVLKITVVNRYKNAKPAVSFIKNFGLKKGAIASTVAHDSHNIVAVGVDDESISRAINLLIEKKGGVSAVDGDTEMILALPVAGLMSDEEGYQVADAYTAIDRMVKTELGSSLASPFMTLSFMALLVIPHLKLSDLGLFDGDSFSFIK
jgi:adenine deaminase